MNRWTNLLLLVGAPLFGAQCTGSKVPSLRVPSCNKGIGTVQYDKSVPNGENKFPLTQVDLCYTDSDIKITFTAFEEVNFFYNESQTTNDPLYEYEVMEAFIYHGTNDPRSYLEFEVSPNNITWQAFIYNPSKVRASGAPFDNGQLSSPIVDGLVTSTALDKDAGIWVSNASIPLGLFNVDDGEAKGTQWRMNFFRTIVSPDTFPDQGLGAWNPTNMSNFHMTPFFGNVYFV
ncbi:hypothetical protein E0Z10_g10730 [Xylaria hypoxylon]|uniref:Carbohydrate-binding domain-containing protein n=1 Tax=Xylaria hypoxylon TaxID=37992 RepID=A0A4Z0YEA2_9PEZI|nr:hypothetical protein E0Z10_g10730 [Xylaria hypoxylon]